MEDLNHSLLLQEEDEEASIVADVDDILNDTERIIGYVDAALAGLKGALPTPSFTTTAGAVAKRKAEELDIPASDEGELAQNGDTSNNKRKPTVQCEECYEVFEDAEKLAWHALNDH